MNGRFVAYFRVSTDRQGRSGLGLEAQQEAVSRFINGRGELMESFTEIESGRKSDRPELNAAIAACRQHQATLVIAKLDRLARNVAFIANLMDSSIDFVAVDMPEANRLTVHILAAVAEHEREMISERTRAALRAAKERGVRLGNPNPRLDQKKATAAASEAARRARELAAPLIEELHAARHSLRQIAAALNRRAIPTARGRSWQAASVRNVLMRQPTGLQGEDGGLF